MQMTNIVKSRLQLKIIITLVLHRKAQCIYEYRWILSIITTNNQKIEKNLLIKRHKKLKRQHDLNQQMRSNGIKPQWRSIWGKCPLNAVCSTCLPPCDLDPPLLSNPDSCNAICSQNFDCLRSCSFIQNVYQQNSDCTTDDDCQNRCLDHDCTKNRCCNNQCREDCKIGEINNINRSNEGKRVLKKVQLKDQPIPYNVTAIERKSRKTVKLKWHHTNNETEPIFYVIEAQWSLSKKHPFTQEVSKWGFIKEEVSHNKAIIRNIHRGRWYSFRVAAVTRYGRSPFSQPTTPFRLTPEPKSIPIPTNITVKNSVFNNDGSYNVTLTWIQNSQSELPITGYKISWKPDSEIAQIVDDDKFVNVELSSTPIYDYTVPYLNVNTMYRFTIRSIISYDDQIDVGPFATITYQMNSSSISITPTQLSSSTTTTSFLSLPSSLRHQRHGEYSVISDLKISEPFFINGLLKANVSWTINDQTDFSLQIQQFDLYWLEVSCTNDVSCCYRRDAATIKNQFQIYDLRFNCTYAVNINPVLNEISKTGNKLSQRFNVTSCSNILVFGSIRPPCHMTNSKNIKYSGLSYSYNRTGENTIGINLQWNPPNNKLYLTGYRLQIEQMSNNEDILTVDLAAITLEYYYPYLRSNIRYNVTLSSIKNHKYIISKQSIILDENTIRNNSKSTTNFRPYTSDTNFELLSSKSNTLRISNPFLLIIFLTSIVYR
ncbi:unnamed protein product [Didymodactylos carnosus]|uniref:Fibronectin type-III domain-containing protein n=1 Tax=Didymodactylos carnosus TaxID=1234261 RepID=A0A814B738_9BILA|nr:unnamed protein product [Didymodactylos carnosus]CAF3702947.1 unnamed protein product [Didymodactylos carnosus]